MALQDLLHFPFHHLIILAELLDDLAAQVGGHDDQRVLEIDGPAFPVGQPAVVQDLEQDVENVGMGFFDLIQEDDGVRAPLDRFRELAALFISHVARGRPDQTGDRVLFHVFGHVQPDHGFFRIKEKLGERPGQFGLSHARRSHKDERPERP